MPVAPPPPPPGVDAGVLPELEEELDDDELLELEEDDELEELELELLDDELLELLASVVTLMAVDLALTLEAASYALTEYA